MGKNTSVLLNEHFEGFIAKQLQSGRYTSGSEVVRDALRLLENEDRKRENLHKLLLAGDESGEAKQFDLDEFKERMRLKHVLKDV